MATFLWFSLVGRAGAVKASAFHFLNPFFGVAIAAILLGDTSALWMGSASPSPPPASWPCSFRGRSRRPAP